MRSIPRKLLWRAGLCLLLAAMPASAQEPSLSLKGVIDIHVHQGPRQWPAGDRRRRPGPTGRAHGRALTCPRRVAHRRTNDFPSERLNVSADLKRGGVGRAYRHVFKNYALKSIDARLKEAAGQSDPELDMSSDLWAALAT